MNTRTRQELYRQEVIAMNKQILANLTVWQVEEDESFHILSPHMVMGNAERIGTFEEIERNLEKSYWIGLWNYVHDLKDYQTYLRILAHEYEEYERSLED